MTTSPKARLEVTRPRTWFGVLRRLDVLVDGERRARLRRGERAELEVDEGDHVLQVRMDWCTSPEVLVSCRRGSVRAFRCRMPGPIAALAAVRSRHDSAFELVPCKDDRTAS